MKEQLINRVLYCMQDRLQEEQLTELKSVLHNVLCAYRVESAERQELKVMDCAWQGDLEDYLMAIALEGKSPETVKRYRYELSRLLSYINKAVADINNTDISGYMRAYKRIRNICNQTLKNVRAVYSSFFVWLRDRNRIGNNPMVLVEQIKVEKKIKKPYTDTERELMLRNCKTIRDKAIMEFFYSTAVRVSELVALNREDIRFTTKDLIVFGKGAKERVTYLNERSHMYLKEYLESRTDGNPALFVSEKMPHQRLTKNGLEDLIRRTGDRVDVHAYPHRFRRTAATNALNRGMPVQEVAQLLGHTKLETTMVYCTVEQESVQFHHKKYLSA
jgi:Site-specific recombinase XerD